MRFPKSDFMKPVFDLFTSLEIEKDGLLVPYILSDDEHNVLYYNGVRMTVAEAKAAASDDPFKIGLATHSDDYVNAAWRPFIKALKDNVESGWDMLMDSDKYSARAYMLNLRKTEGKDGFELKYTDEVYSTLSWQR